ncbi:MAG: hypothetical protein QME07_04090 [bacterium]|nr:hypothetical protein [bacterium]
MKKVLFGSLVLVGMVGVIEAAYLYVPSQYGTISAAISAAATGDTVLGGWRNFTG